MLDIFLASVGSGVLMFVRGEGVLPPEGCAADTQTLHDLGVL